MSSSAEPVLYTLSLHMYRACLEKIKECTKNEPSQCFFTYDVFCFKRNFWSVNYAELSTDEIEKCDHAFKRAHQTCAESVTLHLQCLLLQKKEHFCLANYAQLSVKLYDKRKRSCKILE